MFFATRNMLFGLNSWLHQLAYGKIGFVYVISLKVAVFKNLVLTLNEDLL